MRHATASTLYGLTVHAGERRQLATAWLALAVGALLASGVFSVLLVAARTPGVANWLPGVDFFRVALVVHVDLSVLVWFAACAGMLWSMAGTERWGAVAWIGWGLALIGSLVLAAAPFVEQAAPVMANYVPVLDGTVFSAGLAIFGAGFGLTALRALAVPARVGTMLAPEGALRFGLNTAAVAAAMALLALVWSSLAVPRDLPVKAYYELLFWGPGHVIQFGWSLIMLVAWLWLASLVGARVPLSPRVVVLLFAIGLASVFATPVIYLAWDVTSVEFHRLFTWQMRFGGGLAIVPMAAALAIALMTSRATPVDAQRKPIRAALVASVLLFAAGGMIGFLIQGSDVRIPAHYHGSIVGITLALMGIVY
ncbi:MAG: cytochrome C oxidase subunit I, partial [Gemmatimonadota bacterium]